MTFNHYTNPIPSSSPPLEAETLVSTGEYIKPSCEQAHRRKVDV